MISSLSKKQIRDNRIGLLLDGKVDAEIVVVGSSRALNNYDPQVISKMTGKKTYNFGVSGSNILFHENIIDLLLNSKNKPETIIYNIDDYGALFENSNIIYRKDVLFPYVDSPLINEMIAGQLKKPLIATFFSKTYRQNVNFINGIKFLVYGRENPDYKTTNFDELGANLLVHRPQDPIPVFNTVGYDISGFSQVPEYVIAFKNIQMKCRANNVKLILSLPPLYAASSKGFKEMIVHHILPGIHYLILQDKCKTRHFSLILII
ncbi:MAG: hypothetical protein IPP71_02095 [Bacteroidetes bacterium]|nr:hypothetical protein [Bacteroidota bacterium]